MKGPPLTVHGCLLRGPYARGRSFNQSFKALAEDSVVGEERKADCVPGRRRDQRGGGGWIPGDGD
ncbi:hypothetical protein E2562_013077 [Oryza meyeriana var. granulata]|uniref:Uncharacterized protein n=1 Tax=Oryza meyeriana var. granulata TaxID=110450 RepID=A0A6G1DIE6_9ORYZ|nr:hypothetical protein E2562_013077 [Oryza meyeriana var. granulata]